MSVRERRRGRGREGKRKEGKGRKREGEAKGGREGRRNEAEGRAEIKTGKRAETRTKDDITHLTSCFSSRQNVKPTSTLLISQLPTPI